MKCDWKRRFSSAALSKREVSSSGWAGGSHHCKDCDNEEEQEDEWQDISEVAFVDDMLSFLVYDTDDEVEEWASKVIECFEKFEMKANVSNLEIMVVAWSTGSKPITRQVARGRLKFKVRGITIKAATSIK